MQKKLLIFDFDGTIADTFHLVLEIVNKHPTRYGVDGITTEEATRLKNMEIKYLLKEFNIHTFMLPIILTRIRFSLAQNLYKATPYKDISHLLHEFKQEGYTLGIVSSNSIPKIKAFLKKYELDIFDFVYAQNNFFSKNTMLSRAIKKHNFIPENVLYIGDEVRDIYAGKKANLKVCSVSWGYNSKSLLEKHNPDFIVDTGEELQQVVYNWK